MSSNPAAGASIVASLSLESINPDLYRSKILWCPTGARGVFGGQVIGQALVAATATIGTVVSKDGKKVEAKDEGWGLHSQHCYFILPADPNVPILYQVQRLRDGKSYATRSVVASQNAVPVFHLTCSYTRAGPIPQPSYSEPLPDLRFLFPSTDPGSYADAAIWRLPHPDECEYEEDRWRKILDSQDKGGSKKKPLTELAKQGLRAYISERAESPVAIKEIMPLKSAATMTGMTYPGDDGTPEHDDEMDWSTRAKNRRMLWMKVKDGSELKEQGVGFEKCILAYVSDFQFVGTAAQSVGLSHNSNPKLVMMASLDHTVFFYSSNFTTADWLLHVIESPRTGFGRGVVTGRFYTAQGELIAVTVQEGVIRSQPLLEGGSDGSDRISKL